MQLMSKVGSYSNSDSSRSRQDRARVKGENVSVAVRFRPLTPLEEARGETEQWEALDDKHVGLRTRKGDRKAVAKFAFDHVFGPETDNQGVFAEVAMEVVFSSMDGYNGTVFAYGQTSSGKTHTMHGKLDCPGVIPLSVRQIFTIIENTPGREFLLRVSYIEIYNEVINDLLAPANTNLRLREDKQAGVFVENLKEEVVVSMEHVMSLLGAGEVHRRVGSTNFNAESSRSHSIFHLHIESCAAGARARQDVRASSLNLIDLAGSESSRVGYEAGVAGVRRKEGAYINKSLLTLGTVITKLSEGRSGHVPYRDSKLTRFLQSSLSGSSRVAVVCTVTPAASCSEETHNTLKFGSRAKFVEVKASVMHIEDDKALIKKYQLEIENLKKQLQAVTVARVPAGVAEVPLKESAGVKDAAEEVSQDDRQGSVGNSAPSDGTGTWEQWEQDRSQLEGRISRLQRIILHSSKTALNSDKLEGKVNWQSKDRYRSSVQQYITSSSRASTPEQFRSTRNSAAHSPTFSRRLASSLNDVTTPPSAVGPVATSDSSYSTPPQGSPRTSSPPALSEADNTSARLPPASHHLEDTPSGSSSGTTVSSTSQAGGGGGDGARLRVTKSGSTLGSFLGFGRFFSKDRKNKQASEQHTAEPVSVSSTSMSASVGDLKSDRLKGGGVDAILDHHLEEMRRKMEEEEQDVSAPYSSAWDSFTQSNGTVNTFTAGDLFIGASAHHDRLKEKFEEEDKDTTRLLQEEMQQLVEEAMAKEAELDRVKAQRSDQEERQRELIGELSRGLEEKRAQMTQLENRMVVLAQSALGGGTKSPEPEPGEDTPQETLELVEAVDKLKMDQSETECELQIARADNKVLQQHVSTLQSELDLLRASSRMDPSVSGTHQYSVSTKQTSFLNFLPAHSFPHTCDPNRNIKVQTAISVYQHALRQLQEAEESNQLDAEQLLEIEELHLQALVRIRTAKERHTRTL